MNGAHDMGGVMGFGPVVPEANEPVFHGHWEQRVLAMALAMGAAGLWNIDMSRSARENVPPQTYLSRSYYEIWYHGLLALLAARGLVTSDELAVGKVTAPPVSLPRTLKAGDVAAFLAAGRSAERDLATPPRFEIGDRVRTKNMHPTGHTRLPRYVRGHIGTIELHHGGHVFPDTNALGHENPEHLYTVRFSARELWGESADPTVSISVDAWDSYLEPAP